MLPGLLPAALHALQCQPKQTCSANLLGSAGFVSFSASFSRSADLWVQLVLQQPKCGTAERAQHLLELSTPSDWAVPAALPLNSSRSRQTLHYRCEVYYSNRSAAHAAIQQWREALEDAQACTRLKPRWGKGWSRRGAAQSGLELHGEVTIRV